MFLVLEDIKKEIEDYGERFKLLKTKGFEYPDDEVTTVRIKILDLNHFFSKLNVFKVNLLNKCESSVKFLKNIHSSLDIEKERNLNMIMRRQDRDIRRTYEKNFDA